MIAFSILLFVVITTLFDLLYFMRKWSIKIRFFFTWNE